MGRVEPKAWGKGGAFTQRSVWDRGMLAHVRRCVLGAHKPLHHVDRHVLDRDAEHGLGGPARRERLSADDGAVHARNVP